MKRAHQFFPILLLATATAIAQTAPAPTTQDAGGGDISPEARQILQQLHDRKATLKDFTAKIDNSVQHPAGDTDGTTGTAVYIDDGFTPKLAAQFTHDTEDGKPVRVHKRDFILDGKAFTMLDYKSKEFKQQKAPPDKPFNPNSLDSPIPVPLGLDVDEVARNFTVTVQPSTDPNLEAIRVIPRVKGKYDYKQIDLTIDKKLQLPVKVIVKANGGDITTIKFSDPQVNTGKATLPDTASPKDPGWTIEIK